MKNVFNFLYKNVLPVYISGQLARQNTLQLLGRSAGLGLKTLGQSHERLLDFLVAFNIAHKRKPSSASEGEVCELSELRPQEPACA